MSDAKIGLAPGMEVGSRYRVDEVLIEYGARESFLGTDTRTDARVLLFPLTNEEFAAMRGLVGISHAHLSRVLDIPEAPGGAPILVVEHVPGPTLRDVLSQVDRETPVEAVRSALRVADAVCAVHSAGAVHGCIRPAALIVAPEGHPPPRLTFAAPLEVTSPYRPAERGQRAPSTADDAWAVGALLYEMLLGAEPPAGGVAGEEELLEVGLEDPELRAALARSLAANEVERSHDLVGLRRALASWFVQHAADESSLQARVSAPPPLPPGSQRKIRSVSPVPSGMSTPARVVRKGRIPQVAILAGAAFLLTVGIVWGYFAWGSRRVKVVEAPTSSSAKARSSEASIDLNAVSVVGQEGSGLGDHMATCVAGWLPKEAFGKPPNLAWVCQESDPREGGAKVRAALVSHKPPGKTTDAMRVWSRLGWYEMAAYSVVYGGCCVDSPALKLPDPAPNCARLDEQLNNIGAAVVANQPAQAALDAFEKAATCEARAKRAATYRQTAAPSSDERQAFDEYLKAIQAP